MPKRLIPIVIIEGLIVCFLLSKCFVHMADFYIKPADFYDNIKGKNNISFEENSGIVFFSDGVNEESEALSYEIPMRAGGYNVEVFYDVTDVPEESYEDAYYPITDHTVVGYVDLLSVHSAAVDMTPVILTAGREYAVGRGYIRFGKTIPDVQVRISSSDIGRLTIRQIRVRQIRSWQFMRVFGAILLFAALDYLIFLFLCGLEGNGRAIIEKNKAFLFIVGLTCIISITAFNQFIFSGDDLDYHLMRISQIARELSYGQFPVRIYTDSLNGYGYPSPIFYCDTFLYIPAVLYNLFLPLRMVYNIYIILVCFATVSVCYHSCKSICADRRISAVVTIVYCMSEWRADRIMSGASVGAYTAYIFFPLVVSGCYKIYVEERNGIRTELPLAIGLAGLASCHMLSLEITGLFLVVFAFISWRKTFTKRVMQSLCIAFAEFLLLSLYIIVPFIITYSRQSLQVKESESYIQDRGMLVSQYFQFFYTGVSKLGINGHINIVLGGGLTVGIIAMIFSLFSSSKEEEKVFRNRIMVIITLILISLFMSSRYFPLDFLRDNLPDAFMPVYYVLSVIQFPVRYLCITAGLVLAGLCISLTKLRENDKIIWRGFMWALCICSFFSYFMYLSRFTANSVPVYYTGSNTNIDQDIMGGEYLPDYFSWKLTKVSDVLTEDGVTVDNINRNNGMIRFNVINSNNRATDILLPVFDYGNYHALDGNRNSLPVDTGSDYKLSVSVPEDYNGEICVFYKEPLFWRVCEIISMLTTISAAIIYVRMLLLKKR